MIETIKKDFPLTYKRMVEVMKEQMKDLPPEYNHGLKAEDIVKMLFISPRALVGFFDEQGIHVDTTHIDGEGYDYEIRQHHLYNKPYTDRELAEQAGVEQAFKVMEKQLQDDRTEI